MKRVSPALVRACGFLGFILFGLGAIHLGNAFFRLRLDLWNPPVSGWGAKGLALVAASFLVGLFGIVTGWAVGASIEVRSPKVDHVISIVWHYNANGCIIWMTFSVIALLLTIGREHAKEFVRSFGAFRLSAVILGTATVGSWLIALTFYLTRAMVMRGSAIGDPLSRFLPMAVGLCMGVLQCKAFGVSLFPGIVSGLILPYILIPTSAYMMARDEFQKRAMLSKL